MQDGFAQSSNRFKGGFQAGFTSSQIHGDGFAGFDKAGWTAGFFLENNLSKKSTFQVELNYITKGSFDPPNFQIGKNNWKRIHLGYVEMPLILKFNIKKIILDVGLSGGFLAHEKQSDANTVLEGRDIIIGPFKRYEISYLLGVEYHFNDQWGVSGRTGSSLLPVTNQVRFERIIWGFFGGSYSQYLNLSLRYRFKS